MVVKVYMLIERFISFWPKNKRFIMVGLSIFGVLLSLLFTSWSEVFGLNIIPVAVYSDVISDKEKILQENKGKAGIYKWTNVNDGKFYIGSANDLSRRLHCYLSPRFMTTYKSQSKIYSSLLKYGYPAFNLEILEHCAKSEVISREQYYLDKLNPTYNILKVAGSSLGFKHSEETKSHMSINNTKEKHPFFCKKHTEVSRFFYFYYIKIKNAAKMLLNSKMASPVEIINIKTGVVKSFRSNVDAASLAFFFIKIYFY